MSGTLSVFRNRDFRSIWTATLISNIGTLIQLVGAAWLMTSLTESQSMVALVLAANTLPVMIGSFIAGVFADNYDRRRLMLVAQVSMLCTSVVLTAMALADMLTPWSLLFFTFLIGSGTALHYPSWQVSIGDIVTRDELPLAVSLNAMGMNITRSVGPAMGGAVVAAAGAATAFGINTATYFFIILALVIWRPKLPARPLPPESFVGAFSVGLRYFVMSPHLMKSTFRGLLFGFAAIPVQALLPVIAREQLQASAFIYGVMLGFFGFGAVIAALNNVRIRSKLKTETILSIGFLAFAASSVVLAYSRFLPLSAIALFFAGASWLSVLSLMNVSIQMATPRWVVGRIIALYMTGIFGGMTVGSWGWGLVADHFGTAQALVAAAAVLLLGAVLGRWLPIEITGSVSFEPAEHRSLPPPRLPMNDHSGPVQITIKYQIAEANTVAFLAAMRVRRRVQLRDGARRWSLHRDIETPELWIESYFFSNWLDYRRHRGRKTRTTSEISARVIALHQGNEPPEVRRSLERQTSIPHLSNAHHPSPIAFLNP